MPEVGPVDARFLLMLLCAFLMGLVGTIASGGFFHAL